MDKQKETIVDLVQDLCVRTYNNRHIHKINGGDFKNIQRFIKNGDVEIVGEDVYFVYDEPNVATQVINVTIKFVDTTKVAKKTINKLLDFNIISNIQDERNKYCFSYKTLANYLLGGGNSCAARCIPKENVPYNADGVTIRYFTSAKGGEEYFPGKGETPSIVEPVKPKKYIYKIDFGEYGVYIGQTENIKQRMNGHRNAAKKESHCYVLNELYKSNKEYFNQCLDNVEIIKQFSTYTYLSEVTNLEYQCQIDCLRNGGKLLGKQCWDKEFRNYLAYNIDEYEYQELLYKSYQVNKYPSDRGYSTYNECTKTDGVYIVIKYFDSLRKSRNNS